MSISISEIAVGKCFVTSTGQVRRVLEVKDGKVKYEARGKTDQGGSWGAWVTVGDGRFAQDVDREVTCDWDPIILSVPSDDNRTKTTRPSSQSVPLLIKTKLIVAEKCFQQAG